MQAKGEVKWMDERMAQKESDVRAKNTNVFRKDSAPCQSAHQETLAL